MAQESITERPRPHIVLFPCPGMGHIIPFVDLAKRLILHHGYTATMLTFSNFSSPTKSTFLSSFPSGLSSLSLPHVPLDDLPRDARMEARLAALVSRAVPHVRSALLDLKKSTTSGIAAFVVDLFCPDTFGAAKELSIPHYIFFTCNFMTLSLFFYLPTLDETTSWTHCKTGPTRYNWFVHIGRTFHQAEGILVNSFQEMEPDVIKALREQQDHGYPPIYPVGPLARSSLDETDDYGCLEWLDRQPRGSVLFVSFGSGGTLSTEQTRELAFGLEQSGQRFLWIARRPSDKEAAGAYFTSKSSDDPLSYLPEGFVERTKDVGKVVDSWAPQIKVLGHEATGGFLSHCGWNSSLESTMHGVPMIAWPLFAEQRMNALMLVDGVEIALKPKAREDGVFPREEIAKVVLELMEGEMGEKARRRVKDLRDAGSKALSEEGSSYKALEEVANKWRVALAV
ncbi:LOW QUALITY PROTEIN: hydroquinone glucosyltransferase [Typha latifolia]|uniref:LOW QUALITY PROTEIN: hydroquinone glucosyltransferase n=1 Tax=Typha latifolia TaxID=4733 RepID=UPI003C2C72EB